MTSDEPVGFSRRAVLGAALLGAAAGVVGGAEATLERRAPDAVGRAVVPFHGVRQAGVATPPPAHAVFAALDLVPGTGRADLVRLMRIWTDDAMRLTAGRPGLGDTEPELAAVPASLTVTFGFGPAVFRAAGLERLRPEWLRPLPAFPVDALRPEWSDGDLVVQVRADDPVTVSHALRVLVRQAEAYASVRWVQRGFRRSAGAAPVGAAMRNLFGQVDETRNLDVEADADLIWHPDGPLAGGTSMVVRRIEMDLDGWDQIDRPARELVVGRRLSDGAPLGGRSAHDEPDLEAVGADGLLAIPPFAHVRRARTADPRARFLRRGYSFDDAPLPGSRSNAGLVFVTYQADVTAQFVPVQASLAELDLLNTWTTPVGSAVFALPGGCAAGEYVGQRLLEA